MAPGGQKWLPGGFRWPLGRQVARWRAKGGVRNLKKYSWSAPGGPGGNFQTGFSLPGAPGGRFWVFFGSPWGGFWASVWQFFLQSRKSRFFANTPSENFVFEAPGESFSEPFSSQNGSEKRLRLEMDPNGHQNQIKSAAERGTARAPLEDPLAPRAASRARLLKEKKETYTI